MTINRDNGPQASHFAPHSAEMDIASPNTAAGSDLPTLDDEPRYPLVVRLAIMRLGGGTLWVGLIAAAWRWLR